MANFTVKQSDRLFEARYKEPAFALIKSTSLHQNMFTNLSRHGLVRLNDIRVESGVTNLSDANATYSISTIGAHVRVWLDRLGVFFLDGRPVDAKLLQQVPIAALN